MASPGCAWAEDEAMAATTPVTHVVQGAIVKSISWADAEKGTKSEIVIINPAKNLGNKTINIYVTSTTTFWDTQAKPILPDKIKAKIRINIIYLTTAEGINIAKSIKILK